VGYTMKLISIVIISFLMLSVIACGGGGSTPPADEFIADEQASYLVTFKTVWDAESFPTNYPDNRHFSGLIGATHNEQVIFWELGQYSTLGIEEVAETGGRGIFEEEIDTAIDSGYAEFLLYGGGISSDTSEVTLEFTVSQNNSLVTLVSMVAPSPDWFVGVQNYPLFINGDWITEVTLVLPVYDAGTDSGVSYTSPNSEPIQHDTITLLSSDSLDSDFEAGIHRSSGAHLATFTIKRTQ